MRIVYLFFFAGYFSNIVCSDARQQQLLADLKSVGLPTTTSTHNQDVFYKDYFDNLDIVSWYQELNHKDNKDKVHGTYTFAEVDTVLKKFAQEEK